MQKYMVARNRDRNTHRLQRLTDGLDESFSAGTSSCRRQVSAHQSCQPDSLGADALPWRLGQLCQRRWAARPILDETQVCGR